MSTMYGRQCRGMNDLGLADGTAGVLRPAFWPAIGARPLTAVKGLVLSPGPTCERLIDMPEDIERGSPVERAIVAASPVSRDCRAEPHRLASRASGD